MNLIQLSQSFVFPLAETHLAEVSFQYREDTTVAGPSAWWFMLIPVVAVILGLLVHAFVNRTPAIVNTPLGMLHELCKAHRLNKRSRVLLERVAETLEIQQPAILFAGSEMFDDAVERAASKIQYSKRQKATLGMLRRKLF